VVVVGKIILEVVDVTGTVGGEGTLDVGWLPGVPGVPVVVGSVVLPPSFISCIIIIIHSKSTDPLALQAAFTFFRSSNVGRQSSEQLSKSIILVLVTGFLFTYIPLYYSILF